MRKQRKGSWITVALLSVFISVAAILFIQTKIVGFEVIGTVLLFFLAVGLLLTIITEMNKAKFLKIFRKAIEEAYGGRINMLKTQSHFRPVQAGSLVQNVLKEMLERARFINSRVSVVFHDDLIIVDPDMTLNEAISKWQKQIQKRTEKRQRSFQARKMNKEYEREAEEQQRKFEEVLFGAPAMEISDEEAWKEWQENNQDPYGSAVIRFAENWARIMQVCMSNGESLEECAEEASHTADNEGITGFMYGCAVSVLVTSWKYGERLRRWHNLETQIGDEGYEANIDGGVLNPALLQLGR